MDVFSRAVRSKIMAAVKSINNKSTELAMVDIFRREKLSGWRRKSNLPGKPDFVFNAKKIALFVDGCQWHGCKKHYRLPKTNSNYWKVKIKKNVARDERVKKSLKVNGWKVFRIWEHEIRKFVNTKEFLKFKRQSQNKNDLI